MSRDYRNYGKTFIVLEILKLMIFMSVVVVKNTYLNDG